MREGRSREERVKAGFELAEERKRKAAKRQAKVEMRDED